jgi:hypothetical protein
MATIASSTLINLLFSVYWICARVVNGVIVANRELGIRHPRFIFGIPLLLHEVLCICLNDYYIIRSRLKLLVRQNNAEYDKAIKHLVGELNLKEVDQYILMGVPVEQMVNSCITQLKTYLTGGLTLFRLVIRYMSKVIKVVIKKTSAAPTVVAQYTAMYIYLNGGLVNHESI